MADGVVLLDAEGRWTHRDRHQHHRFPIVVPDGTTALRIRFRWGPQEMGSEHAANGLNLSLFGPDGFRGAAGRGLPDQEIVVGREWSAPGFLAGPLRPGRWSINVDTNEILNDGADAGELEYHVEVTATAGEAQSGPAAPAEHRIAPTPRTRATPASGRGGWWRGDLHSHTVHSDGTITVEDRVRGAVERGLDFLAITDHNTISQAAEHDRWPNVITAIRGSEVTTFHGHMMCLGLQQAIDWRDDARGSGAASIIEQAHRQNALITINHPNAFGDPWCSGCHWDFALVDFATIDAIEVWNGRWAIPETDNGGALAFWTDLLDAGYRLTAISGTDSHSAEEDAYLLLPMTYVHAPNRDEARILDAIREGRAYLSSGPSVSFRARGSDGVEVTLPGHQIPVDGTLDLTVDVAEAVERGTLWFVTSRSMVALGECGAGNTHLAVMGLVATSWWRLELREGTAATGDLRVLTNPVWVQKEKPQASARR